MCMILKARIDEEEYFPNSLFIKFNENGKMTDEKGRVNFSFDDETVKMMVTSGAPSLGQFIEMILKCESTIRELWEVHGENGESFEAHFLPYIDSNDELIVECYKETDPNYFEFGYWMDTDMECAYSECTPKRRDQNAFP